MDTIYKNPEEYARKCNCSLEMAKTRCDHYHKVHELAKEVPCPCCNEKEGFVIEDDYITCRNPKCGETFDFDEPHFTDFVRTECDFDEVLAISESGMNRSENEIGVPWETFVKESTDNLTK